MYILFSCSKHQAEKMNSTIHTNRSLKENSRLAKRIRIGIFTRPIDQGYSGSGHHLLEIVNHMLDENDGTFDFTLIHYEKNDRQIYTRAKELIVHRNPFAAAVALRKECFDIVHYAPLSPYAPVWGMRAKKVATMHGAEPYLVPELYGFLHRFHARFTKPILARKMDAVVAVSKTSRDFLASRFGIPSDRFTVCYNAVGPAYRRLDKEEITAPARLGIRTPYVIHLSNFSERKNPETIIRGYSDFRKSPQGRDTTLVLAGRGWRNSKTLGLAEKLGIGAHVLFPGFISERDTVELLNAAICFVFPSLAEGFGMPNLEAMACGCPVITSSVFAIPEIVGDAALVLDDPHDHRKASEAMRSLVTDSDLRKALIERGTKRVKAFSWKDSAQSLLALYRRLAGTADLQ
jgi:glycosyltransferase involved in cell wall biosynthesis